MAWNHPKSTDVAVNSNQSTRSFHWRRITVTVFVVGVITSFVIFHNADREVKDEIEKTTRRIRDVAPSVSTSQVKSTQHKLPELVEPTEDEILLKGLDTNKWIVVTNPRTGKKFVSRLLCPGRNLPAALYDNNSLNVLDAIMFTDQSDPMFGVQIDKRFMNGLQKALVEGVEISEEDPADKRERKEFMRELLADFKKRLKEGEDLSATIEDSLKERRSIYAFKQMIMQTRKEMRESGASEEEVADFERACNKKLEEKGASPIRTKEDFMKSVLKRRQQKEIQK